MRNEALETHVIESVRLLAAEHPADGFAVADSAGRLFHVRDLRRPARCRHDGGDCADLVASRDSREWQTRADSTDLGRLDSLELSFPPGAGPSALVASARQTFVSTYVFYQSLAWAGSHAGALLASVERGGTSALPGAWRMMRRLGQVEVLVLADGAWQPAGILGEPGPIATDRQIVPLGTVPGESVTVRLRFARGAWRFDELSLATIAGRLEPLVLEPVRVERDGQVDSLALLRLRQPGRYLVTTPGDDYRLFFDLPDTGRRYTLFLESTGHYYEWMRPEWLREENPGLLAMLATDPARTLRHMAPDYSRLEPRLEELFWASRFGGR